MPRTTTKAKQPKLHVKKGDTVVLLKKITSARKQDGTLRDAEKGTSGRVLQVFPKTQRVLVEGVNVRIRHTKPTQESPKGALLEREAPIHLSNVLPADAAGKPTRVGRRWDEKAKGGKGGWVRYAKTTGDPLP